MTVRYLYVFFLLLLIMFTCGCLSEESTALKVSKSVFTNIGNHQISFSNDLNETSENSILNYDHFYNGGGVAIADFNNDALPDVFLTGNQVESALYFNQGNFEFKKFEIDILKVENRWATGALVVDINMDGWLDIYICNSGPDFSKGERRNQLLVNQKGKSFTEEAAKYGIDDDSGSTMAAFFDMDKDADLDLFVINSAQFHKLPISDYDRMEEALKNKTYDHLPGFESQSCHLYENKNGQFVDVTKQSGMLQLGYGLGLITKDFNNDGWTDVYVANDYHIPDNLYINQKDGTFKDEIKQRMRHVPFFSMGCDFEDINLDGAPDLITLDMAPVGHYRSKTLMSSMSTQTFYYLVNNKQYHHQYMFNSLQLNNKAGYFKDIGLFANIAKSEWSWAALLNDFDLDGYNDLYITNGFKRDTKYNDWLKGFEKLQAEKVSKQQEFEHLKTAPSEKTLNYLFKNNGDLTFSLANDDWGLTEPTFSNGAMYADFDNDGDMDLIVNNVDEQVHLYKNNSVENGDKNYLKIKLTKHNRANPIEAINAKIELFKDDKIWFKEWHPVAGFQSSNFDEYIIFGLGDFNKIDSLVVRWNVGENYDKESWLTNVKSNQLIILDLKEATTKTSYQNKIKPLFANARNAQTNLSFLHREDAFDDFAIETLLPHRMSQLGPFISVGDVNNNGESNFFIGGAKGQSGELFVQIDGVFYTTQGLPWQQQQQFEDMGSLWFDADNDGDQDLYVVSGGSTDDVNEVAIFQDRLYLNEGNTFVDATDRLPEINASGSKVIGADYDNDGDVDLFVAGRHLPQQYPKSPKSYLLNNENGFFKEVSLAVGGKDLQYCGMITDAIWMDIDEDEDKDLVLLGEWTGIQIFEWHDGKFTKQNNELLKLTGLWQSITPVDLDKDGDLDLIAGNLGKNSKFKASKEKPLKIRAADFDNNNTNDIVLSTWANDQEVPVRGRQCSSEQMPFIAEKYKTYDGFAKATLQEIFEDVQTDETTELSIVSLAHHILKNNGNGNFEPIEMPNFTQLAPINAVVSSDFNKDGFQDIIIAGNLYETEVETPRYDSGVGQLLLNLGNFKFKELDVFESGIYLPMDVKDIKLIESKNSRFLLVANNNNYLQCYQNLP